MKTTVNFKSGFALLIVFVLSISAFANGDPTTNFIEKSSDATMKLTVPADNNANVTLLNQKGRTVSSAYLVKNNDVRTYDFSEVKEGTYTFIIDTEFKSVEKTILVENQSLKVLNEETMYRPLISVEGDILTISYINLNEEDISIKIEDNSHLYMDKKVGNDVAFGKKLNIEKLPKGEFTATLSTGDNTYNYYFER